MAYAILRFAKHKGGASKALSAHHERTKDSYASNPDIDLSRTAQNFHLVTPRWSYEQEIKHRIQTAGCRVRKDSVKFVDTLVTVSPEFAKAHEAEMPEYFMRAFGFLKERVGEENIISAVVHMDEKTPHMHVFNAGKKREEADALLAQLLPEVESFQAETRRLQDMIASSRMEHRSQQQENTALRKELNKERDRNFEQNVKISALTQRCKRAEKLLDKVSPEVLEHIKRKATARER